MNFELKSEDEQDLLIDIYESFLNSLPCSLQIIVRIRELDVAKYLSDLQTRLSEEREDVYRSQIESYGEFVRHLVAENKILSRRFYVVLSFSGEDADFETAKERLIINADIVAKNFMRLGMGTYQLGSLEVLHLFQGFYNPAEAKQQPITERVTQLLSSIYVRGEK